MFPEIVRDEVFRIESRRLWLRWPTAADAFDADRTTDVQAAAMGRGHRLPGRACIASWRAEMERGSALHLVLEEKASGRTMVGTVRLIWTSDGAPTLDYHLAPDRRGDGLMTEAIQAVVHTLFLMRLAPAVAASPAAADRKGRDVLERCGFTYVGSGMRPCPTGPGLLACDHFRLDRRTWVSLQGWGMTGIARDRRPRAEPVVGPYGTPTHA